MIEPSYLHECFEYDEATGDLFWKRRPSHHFNRDRDAKRWNSILPGRKAGAIKEGYLTVWVCNRSHGVHRIVFAMKSGRWPKDMVDHINGIKSDNRWHNLREANTYTNQQNQKLYTSNKSGVSGVYWRKLRSRWIVKLRVFGKVVTVGSFKNFKDAVKARNAAYKEYGFSNRHGKPAGLTRPTPPKQKSE